MSGRLDIVSTSAGMDYGQGRTDGYTVHGPTTGQDAAHHTKPQSTQPSATSTLRNEGLFTSRTVKNHLIAASGEFLGTLLFLWLAFAGVQTAGMNSQDDQVDPQRLLYMSLSFGMSLLIVVSAFYRISGGLFNPAVTLGLVIASQLNWLRSDFAAVPAAGWHLRSGFDESHVPRTNESLPDQTLA